MLVAGVSGEGGVVGAGRVGGGQPKGPHRIHRVGPGGTRAPVWVRGGGLGSRVTHAVKALGSVRRVRVSRVVRLRLLLHVVVVRSGVFVAGEVLHRVAVRRHLAAVLLLHRQHLLLVRVLGPSVPWVA